MNWFWRWIDNLFGKRTIEKIETSNNVTCEPQKYVLLTVSTAYVRDAFQIKFTGPTASKDMFADFERWYFDTKGSEHYLLQSDNFKTVVCRRFIAGYHIYIQ
jgi:hypothetical protein